MKRPLLCLTFQTPSPNIALTCNAPADLQTSFFSSSSGSGKNDKNQPLPRNTQSTDGSIFLPDRAGFCVIAGAEWFLRVTTNGKYIQLHLIIRNGDKPPSNYHFLTKTCFAEDQPHWVLMDPIQSRFRTLIPGHLKRSNPPHFCPLLNLIMYSLSHPIGAKTFRNELDLRAPLLASLGPVRTVRRQHPQMGTVLFP